MEGIGMLICHCAVANLSLHFMQEMPSGSVFPLDKTNPEHTQTGSKTAVCF